MSHISIHNTASVLTPLSTLIERAAAKALALAASACLISSARVSGGSGPASGRASVRARKRRRSQPRIWAELKRYRRQPGQDSVRGWPGFGVQRRRQEAQISFMTQFSKSLARRINLQCRGCAERRKKIAAALDRLWGRASRADPHPGTEQRSAEQQPKHRPDRRV